MFSWSHLFIGLGVTIAGVLLVRFAYPISNFSGPQDWIEAWAGSGTTSGVYKLLGVVFVLIGLLIATGFGNNVLVFFLSPFKSIFHPLN